MDPTDHQEGVDPDYELSNSVLRNLVTKEKEDKQRELEKKLYKVIEETFDNDLAAREKQLVDIEEKITKAQKLLHLIRYALVTSYYNKKNLQLSASAENDPKSLYDKQSRLHPAIRKLLGSNPSVDVFNVQGKRKAAMKNLDNSEPSTSQGPVPKKPKVEVVEDSKKTNNFDSNQNCLQNRKRIKHRLVVGNISKYMPSLEDDKTTHKWMVYVRGDKTKPDVSDIVEKVVFYLHPSYKPHDVVEVKSPPFHLARRGWGEFPLRVQIFFVCSLNKPIDIIHNLRLDKTMSGRQMLGNESIVDVYLHESTKDVLSEQETDDSCPSTSYFEPKMFPKKEYIDQDYTIENKSNIDKDTSPSAYLNTYQKPSSNKCEYSSKYLKPKVETIVKEEEIVIKEENEDHCVEPDEHMLNYNQEMDILPTTVLDGLNTTIEPLQSSENSFEHNYCQDLERYDTVNNNTAITNLHEWEHSYSRPEGQEKQHTNEKEIDEAMKHTVEAETSLKYGLGTQYLENSQMKMSKKASPVSTRVALTQPIKILPSNMNQLLLSNGQVIQLKVVGQQEPHVKLLMPGQVLNELNLTQPTLKFTSKVNPQLPHTNSKTSENGNRDWFREMTSRSRDRNPDDENDWLLKSLLVVTSLQQPIDESVFSGMWAAVINNIGQELSVQNGACLNSSVGDASQIQLLDAHRNFRIYLPQNKFTNMGQALPFLFRRLPLWHSKAKVEGFRSVYPFMASSREEFESWNIGKKLSCEWSRAKEVRRIVSKENFPLQKSWSTKTFLIYARTHGYSPFRRRPSLTTKEGLENYSKMCFLYNPSLPKHELPRLDEIMDADLNIDVEGNEVGVKKKKSLISVTDPSTKHLCTFVRETARDCGIVLKPEEIVEGVMMNAAERIILEAVKCFADNLLRRAHFYLTCEKGYSEDSTISTSTISKVMRERDEMKAISEFQVGKRMREFYS